MSAAAEKPERTISPPVISADLSSCSFHWHSAGASPHSTHTPTAQGPFSSRFPPVKGRKQLSCPACRSPSEELPFLGKPSPPLICLVAVETFWCTNIYVLVSPIFLLVEPGETYLFSKIQLNMGNFIWNVTHTHTPPKLNQISLEPTASYKFHPHSFHYYAAKLLRRASHDRDLTCSSWGRFSNASNRLADTLAWGTILKAIKACGRQSPSYSRILGTSSHTVYAGQQLLKTEYLKVSGTSCQCPSNGYLCSF